MIEKEKATVQKQYQTHLNDAETRYNSNYIEKIKVGFVEMSPNRTYQIRNIFIYLNCGI